MKPVHQESKTFVCKHYEVWPPAAAILGKSSEEMRASVDANEYNRTRIWERVCGLTEMNLEGRCKACPHLMYLDMSKPLIPALRGVNNTSVIALTDPMKESFRR